MHGYTKHKICQMFRKLIICLNPNQLRCLNSTNLLHHERCKNRSTVCGPLSYASLIFVTPLIKGEKTSRLINLGRIRNDCANKTCYFAIRVYQIKRLIRPLINRVLSILYLCALQSLHESSVCIIEAPCENMFGCF